MNLFIRNIAVGSLLCAYLVVLYLLLNEHDYKGFINPFSREGKYEHVNKWYNCEYLVSISKVSEVIENDIDYKDVTEDLVSESESEKKFIQPLFIIESQIMSYNQSINHLFDILNLINHLLDFYLFVCL